MKSLILAACVGSTVAVVAPQFPSTATLAAAGTGMEVKPFTMYGETTTGVPDPMGLNFFISTIPLGQVASDFVITDVVTSAPMMWVSGFVLKVNGSRVVASENFNSSIPSGTLHLQHGLPVTAGSVIEVEIRHQNPTIQYLRVTLAGYIR